MDEFVRDNLGYHYTSIQTIMKIIDDADDEYIKFHASSVFSLNDPSEMMFGYKEIMRLLPKIEKELNITDPLYKLSAMWEKDRRLDKYQWHDFHLQQMNNSFQHAFSISFSRCRDTLPMWGMYGGQGGGVALALDLRIYYMERMTDEGERLLDITHVGKDQFRAIDLEYDTISHLSTPYMLAKAEYNDYWNATRTISDGTEIAKMQVGAMTNIMNISAPLIKNKAYSYEKESRIVVPKVNLGAIKFKMNPTGCLIPYVEVNLPTSSLKEIIVGPCNDFSLIKKCIELRLMQKNINGVEIVSSNIPYRQ